MTIGDVFRFLVDSGASKHMCKDEDLFTNTTPKKAVVVLGDGSELRVNRKEDVDLPTAFGIMHLMDVLFVPALSASLFSAACASSHGA